MTHAASHSPQGEPEGAVDGSCLTALHVERGDGAALVAGRLRHLDLAEGALIAHDVLLQGTEEALGVLGSEDDAAAYLSLRQAREHAGEVDDELAARVGDDGKVGVLALSLVGGNLYLQPLLQYPPIQRVPPSFCSG